MEEEEEPILEVSTSADAAFIPPSVDRQLLASGSSYTYHSPIPKAILDDLSQEVVLGVDEAGRGPVIGPMVYGLLYLPISQHHSLLAQTHSFNDSKVLTPSFRSHLLSVLCTPSSDLFETCGWATRTMSARDISSDMFRFKGTYNLNAQAMDATIALIREVLAKGVNVREIYIDTIGQPETYQRKLERLFPGIAITVAKKADSLFPCVSAASVCAKVTRDVALEVMFELFSDSERSELKASKSEATGATGTSTNGSGETGVAAAMLSNGQGWGSGYPSDARCTSWLKAQMDPLFGWGSECRFSWGTVKDLLDSKTMAYQVEWEDGLDDDDTASKGFMARWSGAKGDEGELEGWFGRTVGPEVF